MSTAHTGGKIRRRIAIYRKGNMKDNKRLGISAEVLKQYDVRLDNGVYTFPLFDATGKFLGNQNRKYDELTDEKSQWYSWGEDGEHPLEKCIFGQPTSKYVDKGTLVFCEGATDALAAREMVGTRASTFTFVGAMSATVMAKTIATSWEWASRFKQVLYVVDNDEAGKRAAAQIEALNLPNLRRLLLPPVAEDVRDLLRMGKQQLFLDSLYAVTANALECVMSPEEMVEAYTTSRGTAYPTGLTKLDEILGGGLYPHELSVWLAGSGNGKSTFGRCLLSKQENAAYIPFEESAQLALTKYYKTCFHNTPNAYDEDLKYLSKRTSVVKTEKVNKKTVEEWLSWLGAFIVSSGRDFFLIDHITTVAQTLSGDSERDKIQRLMAGMTELVKRYPIHIAVLSQINRPSIERDGEGNVINHPVTLTSGFGSSAIEQYAFVVLGIDGRDDTTNIRILKDRNGGKADRDGKLYVTVPYDNGLYGTSKVKLGTKDNGREIQQYEVQLQGHQVRLPDGDGLLREEREISDAPIAREETLQAHGDENMDAHARLPDTDVLHRDERSFATSIREENRNTYLGIWRRVPVEVQTRFPKPEDTRREQEHQCWTVGKQSRFGMDIDNGRRSRALGAGERQTTIHPDEVKPADVKHTHGDSRENATVPTKNRLRRNKSIGCPSGHEVEQKEKAQQGHVPVQPNELLEREESTNGVDKEQRNHSEHRRWQHKRERRVSTGSGGATTKNRFRLRR
jgi:KaiC/GvpD/RAD55 family RecA-like ATPase